MYRFVLLEYPYMLGANCLGCGGARIREDKNREKEEQQEGGERNSSQ